MASPKLRFPGFTEEWEEKKLEDVVEFLDGMRKPLEKGERISGEYPYYGASGIIDYVKDYIFDEELILLSEDGANIIDRNYRVCFIAKGKYWVNNHAHVLRAHNKDSNIFICEQLESFDYRKYNTGTAQPKLNQDVCRKIKLMVPSLNEQQKISEFISKIDDKILNQENIIADYEEQKKSLMQKIFSQEIRFKRDDGTDYSKWRKVQFKTVFENFEYGMNVAATRYDGENKYIRITDIDDNSHNYLDDDIVSPSGILDDKYLVRKDDILFARTGASTGKTYLYNDKDGKMYFAGFLIRGHVKQEYNSYFIFVQTLSEKYDKWVKVMSIRSGQPGINATEYASFSFMCPCLEEQQKIADCLSAMDRKIEAEKRILEDWKQLKKGLLQQMFV